jgi:hypothetical protein
MVLIWYERRKFSLELSDYGLSKDLKPYLKAGLYGFLLFFVLYSTLNLAASATMHNLYIWRIAGFLEMFLYIFIGLLIFEIFFRGLIQNKLYQFKKTSGLIPTRWGEIIKSALLTGVIEGLALGVIVTMLLGFGGFDVISGDLGALVPQDMGITIGWLPPMFILIPCLFVGIEVALGLIKAGLYREVNRNIFASTLFVALILAWLLSVILPAVNPYAPRFVFMT